MDTTDRLSGVRSSPPADRRDSPGAPRFDSADSIPCAEPLFAEFTAGSRVSRAMAQLSPNDRAVLELRTFEGKSFGDVGIVLGCSADAARTHWIHALCTLQEILSQSNEESSSGATSHDRPHSTQ